MLCALEFNAFDTARLAELAPVIDGKPDVTKIATIDLEALGKQFRMQKIIFETARDIFDQMRPTWKAVRTALLAQLIRIVEKCIGSEQNRHHARAFCPGRAQTAHPHHDQHEE